MQQSLLNTETNLSINTFSLGKKTLVNDNETVHEQVDLKRKSNNNLWCFQKSDQVGAKWHSDCLADTLYCVADSKLSSYFSSVSTEIPSLWRRVYSLNTTLQLHVLELCVQVNTLSFSARPSGALTQRRQIIQTIRLSSSMPLVQREVREICLNRSGSDTLLFYWRHQEFQQRVGRSVWCAWASHGWQPCSIERLKCENVVKHENKNKQFSCINQSQIIKILSQSKYVNKMNLNSKRIPNDLVVAMMKRHTRKQPK